MRFFLDISFRGACYHGWQRQPGDMSVQQRLEEAMCAVLKASVAVTGAGRTDTGVNARCMPAHFDWPVEETVTAERLEGLRKALNAICRPDIVVNSIRCVADDAHARFDATRRTYRYFVHTEPDPFVYPLSWQAPRGLDFGRMNEAARHLLGRQDFTSLSKLHTDVKTNICNVATAEWRPMDADGKRWYFEISADRFLRNMVRATVGTLVDVGRGKYAPEHVKEVLAAMDRCAAGTSMPAHALFLWEVAYPYEWR